MSPRTPNELPAPSLRGHLLRLLLLPVAALLGTGAVAAYFLSLEPASDAYDQALVDIGLALGERVRVSGGSYTFDLPGVAERALRTDQFDTIYYSVRNPDGAPLAGDPELPPLPAGRSPGESVVAYDGIYRNAKVRVIAMALPCEGKTCTIYVAETTRKRNALARNIVLSSVVPAVLIALAALSVVWFGVKRGLAPLEALSEEIRARSARDLRPIDLSHSPDEAKPLVQGLNQLLGRVDEANRNQQRFLANAAHQLRTPLAGLQAHTELALAQPVPEQVRAELEHVHGATVRTARLASQLLALARVEPGGRPSLSARVNLRRIAEESADEWVRRALAKDIDFGFELADAAITGEEFLLREAYGNLVHNALEYTLRGGHVTVRTGLRNTRPILEVEDDGPGIPLAERERVLERFYRLAGSSGSGSGLGLAIVREIALAHGAELLLEAGVHDRGCRATLAFPPLSRS
ncbi:MAG TPA: sensor histidine kinase N-terminal domain-containing protein [Burkholderiales bacterium]|nr:sensor histidine kinase N-terminal domain-containing protein [Burkholderiales bacterium]